MEPLFSFFGLLRGCLCPVKSGETISGLQTHNALLRAETEAYRSASISRAAVMLAIG